MNKWRWCSCILKIANLFCNVRVLRLTLSLKFRHLIYPSSVLLMHHILNSMGHSRSSFTSWSRAEKTCVFSPSGRKQLEANAILKFFVKDLRSLFWIDCPSHPERLLKIIWFIHRHSPYFLRRFLCEDDQMPQYHFFLHYWTNHFPTSVHHLCQSRCARGQTQCTALLKQTPSFSEFEPVSILSFLICASSTDQCQTTIRAHA